MKWVGGKTQLLSQLYTFLPKKLFESEFTYIEPFVGGGAMFFYMLQQFCNIKKAVINDINENLIAAYRTIKDEPDQLVKELADIEKKYLCIETQDERKQFFLEARSHFNDDVMDSIEKTTYLLFLNRTCFNGMYRVNSKGKFNVPFGKYSNPTICNAEVIFADSKLLNQHNVDILCGDYSETENYIDSDGLNFVYMDPPYRPLSATSSFTSYSEGDFNDDDQKKLADFCRSLTDKGCLWMQSNADCKSKNPDDTFFDDQYQGFEQEHVYASRSINADPSKRGKLTELLIHNQYDKNECSLF